MINSPSPVYYRLRMRTFEHERMAYSLASSSVLVCAETSRRGGSDHSATMIGVSGFVYAAPRGPNVLTSGAALAGLLDKPRPLSPPPSLPRRSASGPVSLARELPAGGDVRPRFAVLIQVDGGGGRGRRGNSVGACTQEEETLVVSADVEGVFVVPSVLAGLRRQLSSLSHWHCSIGQRLMEGDGLGNGESGCPTQGRVGGERREDERREGQRGSEGGEGGSGGETWPHLSSLLLHLSSVVVLRLREGDHLKW